MHPNTGSPSRIHTHAASPPITSPLTHIHTGTPPHTDAQHPHKHTHAHSQRDPHTNTGTPSRPPNTQMQPSPSPPPRQPLSRGLPHRGVRRRTPPARTVLTFPICWPQTKCGEDEQEPPDDGEGLSSSARLHSSFFNWTKSPFPKTKQSKKKSKIVRFLSSPRPLKITSGGGEAGQGK